MNAAASSIVVADLGLGNLRSVEKSIERVAESLGLTAPMVTSDAAEIARAKILVVPGQGAFRDGAAALAADDGARARAIRAAIDGGARYLGICLGLQLLFDESEEAPGARGLGVFAGRVARIPNAPDRKVPHVGWNQPRATNARGAALLAPAGTAPWFYFVHSYHALADDPSIVAAVAEYGCMDVTAIVARDRVVATQFHPEKSQRAGLAFLRAFLAESPAPKDGDAP